MVSGEASAVLIRSLFNKMGLPLRRVSSIKAGLLLSGGPRHPYRQRNGGKCDWCRGLLGLLKKLGKVHQTVADEASEQRGSYSKVNRGAG